MSFRTQSRYRTPPHVVDHLTPQSVGSDRSYRRSPSSSTSPSSINTQSTTPPRSPGYSNSREILPRIRKQDQMLDPIAIPPVQHRRCESNAINALPMSYNRYEVIRNSERRSASPADLAMITPISAISYMDSGSEWSRHSPPPNSLENPVAYGSHSRSMSASSVPKHYFPDVTSAPVEGYMTRFAYPTYRQAPVYVTSNQSFSGEKVPNPAAPVRASNLAPLATSAMPVTGTEHFPLPLSPELDFESYVGTPPTTNLLNYLTQPNPSPAIVRKASHQSRIGDLHYWWDIRNIRAWSDFSLETIQSIPGLSNLLELDIPEPALPTPSKGSLHPETLSALLDSHTAHYVTKVNAALKVSLGTHHLQMRPEKPSTQPGAPQMPEFMANYAEDLHGIPPAGQARSRVVGLVRSYEDWNSGMRADCPTTKVKFLRELALLHRYMRDHACRYGFIITEIELVCVRMGNQTSGYPYFGLLELATPIQLNAKGKETLTAPLALWYLHMLAGNSPLPGQCSWKVEIGHPSDLSRRKIAERDAWINLKPEGREKRDARRTRGWVFPEEPLSRRENGRPRRWTKKMEKERLEKTRGVSIAY